MITYRTNPDDVRGNVFQAWRWAKARLTWLEGRGHDIQLGRAFRQDGFVCSFAKPSWAGDHCGPIAKTGADAIVDSVLEYEKTLD